LILDVTAIVSILLVRRRRSGLHPVWLL
jgi:hypothetical protein